MKTFFDIGDFVYELLDNQDLLNLLDGGKIWREQKPQSDLLTSDIVLVTNNFSENYEKEVKTGLFFINILTPKLTKQHNLTKIEKIQNKIFEILNNSNRLQENETIYFNIISTNLTTFYENNNFSQLIIRIEFELP